MNDSAQEDGGDGGVGLSLLVGGRMGKSTERLDDSDCPDCSEMTEKSELSQEEY